MNRRRVTALLFAAAAAPLAALPAAAQPPDPAASASREAARGGGEEVVHARTVQAAIDALPGPLKSFYKAHRAEMPSQGAEPVFPPRNPARRFLVDRLLPFPFSELPRSEAALQAAYGQRAEGVGRLPWLVQESYARLRAAIKTGERAPILAESDLLAGLLVDLHTPVQLTENFDGQKTGQHGLNLRLTGKLPLALGAGLKLAPGTARYLDDPNEYVFSMLTASYVWLDNQLYLEELSKRGKPGYGEIYFEDLARRLGPILRERLSSAAEDAGSYWYTAWTAAGRPALR